MPLKTRFWPLLTERQFRLSDAPDSWLVAGLIVLNPFAWGWIFPATMAPDAVAYLTFAENGISAGKLYLPAWGHLDVGALLPPLYPALIAVANIVRPDSIANGLLISSAAMMLASVALYFYVKRIAGLWPAVATALLVQFNWHYLFFGSRILTEALFLIVTVCTLLLLLHRVITSSHSPRMGATVGALTGLTFLTRHVGLVLLIFVTLWFIGEYLYYSDERRRILREALAAAGGWAVVILPFVALLYYQTGTLPLVQSFRLNNYVVYSEAAAVLNQPNGETVDPSDYADVYRKRRALRALVPSGEEMLAYVVEKPDTRSQSANITRSIGTELSRVFFNLKGNLSHLTNELGAVPVWAAGIAMLTAVLLPNAAVPRRARLILPGFIVCYAVAVSAVSGAIARYFTVLFPFLFAMIVAELGLVLTASARRDAINSRIATVLGVAILGAIVASTPTLLEAPVTTRTAQAERLVRRPVVPEHQAMFALAPVYAYLSGGSYRILPNDSLSRVIRYGQLTGVRWLLIPEEPEKLTETQFYTNAPWLADPQALKTGAPPYLKYCCAVAPLHRRQLLFEILSSPPPHPEA